MRRPLPTPEDLDQLKENARLHALDYLDELGVPSDLLLGEGEIETIDDFKVLRDSGGDDLKTVRIHKVVFQNRWAVDLDASGCCGDKPPYRV